MYINNTFIFSPNYRIGTDNVFTVQNNDQSEPFPPILQYFMLLNGTPFLLLNGTNFLLVSNTQTLGGIGLLDGSHFLLLNGTEFLLL